MRKNYLNFVLDSSSESHFYGRGGAQAVPMHESTVPQSASAYDWASERDHDESFAGLPSSTVDSTTKKSALNRRRVLIVEDNTLNLLILEKHLVSWGYETCSAVNGVAALEIDLKFGPFDLVLMDLLMPEMDGWEASRKLLERHPGLDILAITASDLPAHEKSALDVGMVGFLKKPYDAAQLRTTIEHLLSKP